MFVFYDSHTKCRPHRNRRRSSRGNSYPPSRLLHILVLQRGMPGRDDGVPDQTPPSAATISSPVVSEETESGGSGGRGDLFPVAAEALSPFRARPLKKPRVGEQREGSEADGDRSNGEHLPLPFCRESDAGVDSLIPREEQSPGLASGAAEESPSAGTPGQHQNGSGIADADGNIPAALISVENDRILLAESSAAGGATAAAGAGATMPSVPSRFLDAARGGSRSGGSVPAPPGYAQANPVGSGGSSCSTGGGSSSTGEARGQGDDSPDAPPSDVSAAAPASGGFGHGGGGGDGDRGEAAGRTISDSNSSGISSGASPVAPDAGQQCVSSGQGQAGGKGTGVGSGKDSAGAEGSGGGGGGCDGRGDEGGEGRGGDGAARGDAGSDADEEEPECRVCRGDDEGGARPLVHPCRCRGSIKYVHQVS